MEDRRPHRADQHRRIVVLIACIWISDPRLGVLRIQGSLAMPEPVKGAAGITAPNSVTFLLHYHSPHPGHMGRFDSTTRGDARMTTYEPNA